MKDRILLVNEIDSLIPLLYASAKINYKTGHEYKYSYDNSNLIPVINRVKDVNF